MSNKQTNTMLNISRHFLYLWALGVFLLMPFALVQAADLSLANVGVVSLADNKLQVQLEMTGGNAVLPKVFQTDNPARIALDFSGVKNTLSKKMYPINQGTVSNVYIAATDDRVRVVINLLDSTPFETKVVDNKVLLTLSQNKTAKNSTPLTASNASVPVPIPTTPTAIPAKSNTPISSSVPILSLIHI